MYHFILKNSSIKKKFQPVCSLFLEMFSIEKKVDKSSFETKNLKVKTSLNYLNFLLLVFFLTFASFPLIYTFEN